MRVFFGGSSVRGPAGMADTEGPIHRARANGFFQVAQFALGAPDGELRIVTVNRQTGRIVAAILEPLQAFEDNRNRAMRSDVTDDSTHSLIIGGLTGSCPLGNLTLNPKTGRDTPR